MLHVLWASDEPMTSGEVREKMGGDLAYTTVMTIQTRLLEKGLVERERRGRAYAYRTTVSEAEFRAGRMQEALVAAQDREAALSHFVDRLSPKETDALRAILADLESPENP